MRTLALAALALIATPSAATDPGQGRATVECRVAKTGRLTACVLLSETPKGAGVGAFALKLVGAYRIAPHDRRIRNGRITIPMTFKLPGASAEA